MKRQLQFIAMTLFVGIMLAAIGTGCHTAEGFGKDMEDAGEKIQEETR
jgi:predicted small secreted protein